MDALDQAEEMVFDDAERILEFAVANRSHPSYAATGVALALGRLLAELEEDLAMDILKMAVNSWQATKE